MIETKVTPKRVDARREALLFESAIFITRSQQRQPSADYLNALYDCQPYEVIRVVTWLICVGGVQHWIGSDEYQAGEYGAPSRSVAAQGLSQAYSAGLIERVVDKTPRGTLALYRIRDMRGGQ